MNKKIVRREKGKNVDWKRQEFGRKAAFSQLGYDTLITWDYGLKDKDAVVRKIEDFIEGSGK